MTTYRGTEPLPKPRRIGLAGRLRQLGRGLALGLVTLTGLLLLLLLRLIERPIFGLRRPFSPVIPRLVCRVALWIFGIRLTVRGTPMAGRGAVVANHASWFDIFTLNAVQQVFFVSKAEVAGWPGIGLLARATGTLFIERKGSEALAQKNLLEARLRAGHRLLFFPEGTSTDGRRVLPFKSTLFAAFFAGGLDEILSIQPVSVIYRGPEGEDPRFYGWWGDMAFGPHLGKMLEVRRHGAVEVVLHPPVRVADFRDRKALALHCETVIRNAFPPGLLAETPEATAPEGRAAARQAPETPGPETPAA